jgi:hypothetical protein
MGIDIGNKPAGSKITLDQQVELKNILGISRSATSFGPISSYFNTTYFVLCNESSFLKEGQNVTTVSVNSNLASGEINLSNISSLIYLDCGDNFLTSVKIRNSPILYLDASMNNLSQIVIDSILRDLNSSGVMGGYCDLTGGTNAAPSILGVKYRTALQNKGWSISTN